MFKAAADILLRLRAGPNLELTFYSCLIHLLVQ